jgi:hypothetical protein
VVTNEQKHSGNYSIKYAGSDNSATESYCYFNVFDVNIPVYEDSKLVFWNYPLNSNGRYVSIDLLMTDGSRLKDIGATDIAGGAMAPSAGRGTVNLWTENTCNIGQWLNGKTIDRIFIGYDHPAETGDFSGYIDDIYITTQGVYTRIKTDEKNEISHVKVYPNPVENWMLTLELNNDFLGADIELTLYNIQGKTILKHQLSFQSKYQFSLDNMPNGVYILSIRCKDYVEQQKIIVN